MAPSVESLWLYKRGPGTGARGQDAPVGRLSGVEPRDRRVVFEPGSEEGMKCSSRGQHEHTGSRLHSVLLLPLGIKYVQH